MNDLNTTTEDGMAESRGWRYASPCRTGKVRYRTLLGVVWLLAILVLQGVTAASLRAELPDWLTRAESMPTPGYAAHAPAVVLCDDTSVVVQSNGVATTTHRYAVRILDRSGRKFAVGSAVYLEKNDDVTSLNAWIVRAGKMVRPWDKIGWVDFTGANAGSLYSEVRVKNVDYSGFAIEGDVFAYETVVEGKITFPQLLNSWEAGLPEAKSSFKVKLPNGWSCSEAVAGEAAALLKAVGTDEYSWTMTDLPYFPEEPAEASDARLVTRLMLTLSPADTRIRGLLPVFKTWADVSAWICPMSDEMCDSSATLEAAAKDLVKGETEMVGKIRSLGVYVQSTRYVSIEKGLKKGFGCRPRAATEVFTTGWGDCKAKANLLRAMLRTIGIKSYLVSADTETGRKISETWPSVCPFNHAILAIAVDSSVDLASVVDVPAVGRLLFFDPTNPDVVLGDLPRYLQGTKVYIEAPGNPGLTELPVLPPERSGRIDRSAVLTLADDGSLTGEIIDTSFGEPGAVMRARHKDLKADDFRNGVIARLNGSISGAAVSDLAVEDHLDTGAFTTRLKLTAPKFAQRLPGGLMVVRLNTLGCERIQSFPAAQRKLPVELAPVLLQDETRVALPAGYVVDELPEAFALESAYGSCHCTYAMESGNLVARRTVRIARRTVPVSEYAELRKFFSSLAAGDHGAAVLRQGP